MCDTEASNASNSFRFCLTEGSVAARQVQYTPRLGRESEELDDDVLVTRDLRAA